VQGASRLAATLAEQRELALLFRRLATLDKKALLSSDVDRLRWSGPTPALVAVAEILEDTELPRRAAALAPAR
jgi:hypothetical protein